MAVETQKPYQISYSKLAKIVMKSYKNIKKPLYFPSVDEIDSLIGREEFSDLVMRDEVLKYFIACMIPGFSRDADWHAQNPGMDSPDTDNLICYLLKPMEGKEALCPHIMIWNEDAGWDEMEDTQTAFEYMQALLNDPEIYVLPEIPVTKEENREVL